MTSSSNQQQPPVAQKDPRKVEAGRKGAAARKAKQEKLQDELRGAKASLAAVPVPVVAAKAHEQQKEHSTVAPAVVSKEHAKAVPVIPALTGWTPYIACSLGIAVLWLVSHNGRDFLATHSITPTSAPQGSPPPVQMPPTISVPMKHHLKAGVDPFYMQ